VFRDVDARLSADCNLTDAESRDDERKEKNQQRTRK